MDALPTPTLSAAEYLEAIRHGVEDTLARAADSLDAAVPACPGWTVGEVLGHEAFVFDWATAQLRSGDPTSGARTDFAAGDDVVGAFTDTASTLVSTLEATDPDRPTWGFGPMQPTAAFWFRRMAQEIAMHRVDIAAATEDPVRVDTALAVDGVNEFAQTFLATAGRRGITGSGETVHLHATDVDDDVAARVGAGEWMFAFGPDGVDVDYTHGKGDMAARGSAFDLLCFVWNRRPVELTTFGDTDILEFWPAKVTI